MFNKLKEAIALAEAKEFEENALDLMLEDSVFDEDLYEFMKQDIVKLAENLEEDDEDFDDLAFYDEAFKFKKGNTGTGTASKNAINDNKAFYTASPGDSDNNKTLGAVTRYDTVHKIATGKSSKTLNKHFNLKDSDIDEWKELETAASPDTDIDKGLKELNKVKNKKGNKSKGELLKKVGGHIVRNKGKYALGAAALAATGAGAYYLHKKHKAKKMAEKAKEKGIQENFVNFEFDNSGQIILYQEEIDFLYEAFDYEFTENNIVDIISEGIICLVEECEKCGGENSEEESKDDKEPAKDEKSKDDSEEETDKKESKDDKEPAEEKESNDDSEEEPAEEKESKEKKPAKEEELDEGCCKKAIKNEAFAPVRGLIFESKKLPEEIDKELDDDVEIEELLESVCEDF